MLHFTDAQRNDYPLGPSFQQAWNEFATAIARETPSHEESEELRYFQKRAKRELELAVAATNPKAAAIHLELVHAYRQRVRELRPRPEILSWLDEGGAHLPFD